MSKFGWSLPPGCTQRHIDEALGGDSEAEAFYELMFDQMPLTMDEEAREKLVDWTWKQMGESYSRGYQDGQADEQFANELKQKWWGLVANAPPIQAGGSSIASS